MERTHRTISVANKISWYNNNYVRILMLGMAAGLFFFLAFHYIPVWMLKAGKAVGMDNNTGPVGDTYGGILGPIIGVIAAFLTFLAFLVQYQANQQQRTDLKLERFENKFFEMLRLHRENVNEMIIEGYDYNIIRKNSVELGVNFKETKEETIEPIQKDTSGRKIFVAAFTELIACYEICRNTLHFESIDDKDEYLMKMAYFLFFNGAGNDLIVSVNSNVKEDQSNVSKCKVELMKARKQHEDSYSKNNKYKIPNSNIEVDLFFKYKPFSGHGMRFGHYFRHLFLMVKFVVKQPGELLDFNEKREYLRILRAQLSNHEQLFLYLNYLSGYGEAWENETNKYFSDYRMIHNLPILLAMKIKNPHTHFKDAIERVRETGEEMFEADEH